MGAFFTLLLAKISKVVQWVADLWIAIFVAAWDLLKDAFSWVVDQFMGIALSAASSLDISGIQTNLSAFGSLPANVLEVLSALGMGTAFGIIAAAIGIRLVLQLIPFTRLGS